MIFDFQPLFSLSYFNVNVKSIKAIVNLEHPAIGVNQNYPIEIIKDEIPENIDLSLSTNEVNLIIERKIYKRVRIKTNIVDKVKEGYILGQIKIIPDSIIINGPESQVKSIDFVRTNSISIENETGRIVKEISIDKTDMSNLEMDISNVRIIIPIIEFLSILSDN